RRRRSSCFRTRIMRRYLPSASAGRCVLCWHRAEIPACHTAVPATVSESLASTNHPSATLPVSGMLYNAPLPLGGNGLTGHLVRLGDNPVRCCSACSFTLDRTDGMHIGGPAH